MAARGQLPAIKSGKQWLIEGEGLAKPKRKTIVADPHSDVDLTTALRHIQATDLKELWVPDVLRFKDYLVEPRELISTASERLLKAAADPITEVAVAKTPFFTRSAVLLTIEDRVAYQAVVAAISPAIESALPEVVYSARLSNSTKWFLKQGTKQWVLWKERVRAEVAAKGPWLIKSDLTGFFDTIPHDLLMADIASFAEDKKIVDALSWMLSTWAIVPGRGIPQGPSASRVLGNMYMIPIDEAMLAAGFNYSRYLDDIRIVGGSKMEVISGLRLFEKECRRRGLIVSSAKTSLLEGKDAQEDGAHPERDAAQYFFEIRALRPARRELKKILRTALKDDGHIDQRDVRFSLWRLSKIREYTVLGLTLKRLEDLAPVASVVAAYLKHFVHRQITVNGISRFLSDSSRVHSTYLVTWLFAVMLERRGIMPEGWAHQARLTVRDKNQPAYLRAVAAVVMARGGKRYDISWIRSQMREERDVTLLRGYATALAWTGNLSPVDHMVLKQKGPALVRTSAYLATAQQLPSLIDSSLLAGI